jgi:glyceraldehyde-3-phosphate dehydrogenase/erythrose-4-phosphate dehydrogenase
VQLPEKIRVIQYGLGPIGSAAARLIAERDSLELVGAVDIDPAKTAKDLGALIGLGDTLGIEVRESISCRSGRSGISSTGTWHASQMHRSQRRLNTWLPGTPTARSPC